MVVSAELLLPDDDLDLAESRDAEDAAVSVDMFLRRSKVFCVRELVEQEESSICVLLRRLPLIPSKDDRRLRRRCCDDDREVEVDSADPLLRCGIEPDELVRRKDDKRSEADDLLLKVLDDDSDDDADSVDPVR